MSDRFVSHSMDLINSSDYTQYISFIFALLFYCVGCMPPVGIFQLLRVVVHCNLQGKRRGAALRHDTDQGAGLKVVDNWEEIREHVVQRFRAPKIDMFSLKW